MDVDEALRLMEASKESLCNEDGDGDVQALMWIARIQTGYIAFSRTWHRPRLWVAVGRRAA